MRGGSFLHILGVRPIQRTCGKNGRLHQHKHVFGWTESSGSNSIIEQPLCAAWLSQSEAWVSSHSAAWVPLGSSDPPVTAASALDLRMKLQVQSNQQQGSDHQSPDQFRSCITRQTPQLDTVSPPVITENGTSPHVMPADWRVNERLLLDNLHTLPLKHMMHVLSRMLMAPDTQAALLATSTSSGTHSTPVQYAPPSRLFIRQAASAVRKHPAFKQLLVNQSPVPSPPGWKPVSTQLTGSSHKKGPFADRSGNPSVPSDQHVLHTGTALVTAPGMGLQLRSAAVSKVACPSMSLASLPPDDVLLLMRLLTALELNSHILCSLILTACNPLNTQPMVAFHDNSHDSSSPSSNTGWRTCQETRFSATNRGVPDVAGDSSPVPLPAHSGLASPRLEWSLQHQLQLVECMGAGSAGQRVPGSRRLIEQLSQRLCPVPVHFPDKHASLAKADNSLMHHGSNSSSSFTNQSLAPSPRLKARVRQDQLKQLLGALEGAGSMSFISAEVLKPVLAYVSNSSPSEAVALAFVVQGPLPLYRKVLVQADRCIIKHIGRCSLGELTTLVHTLSDCGSRVFKVQSSHTAATAEEEAVQGTAVTETSKFINVFMPQTDNNDSMLDAQLVAAAAVDFSRSVLARVVHAARLLLPRMSTEKQSHTLPGFLHSLCCNSLSPVASVYALMPQTMQLVPLMQANDLTLLLKSLLFLRGGSSSSGSSSNKGTSSAEKQEPTRHTEDVGSGASDHSISLDDAIVTTSAALQSSLSRLLLQEIQDQAAAFLAPVQHPHTSLSTHPEYQVVLSHAITAAASAPMLLTSPTVLEALWHATGGTHGQAHPAPDSLQFESQPVHTTLLSGSVLQDEPPSQHLASTTAPQTLLGAASSTSELSIAVSGIMELLQQVSQTGDDGAWLRCRHAVLSAVLPLLQTRLDSMRLRPAQVAAIAGAYGSEIRSQTGHTLIYTTPAITAMHKLLLSCSAVAAIHTVAFRGRDLGTIIQAVAGIRDQQHMFPGFPSSMQQAGGDLPAAVAAWISQRAACVPAEDMAVLAGALNADTSRYAAAFSALTHHLSEEPHSFAPHELTRVLSQLHRSANSNHSSSSGNYDSGSGSIRRKTSKDSSNSNISSSLCNSSHAVAKQQQHIPSHAGPKWLGITTGWEYLQASTYRVGLSAYTSEELVKLARLTTGSSGIGSRRKFELLQEEQQQQAAVLSEEVALNMFSSIAASASQSIQAAVHSSQQQRQEQWLLSCRNSLLPAQQALDDESPIYPHRPFDAISEAAPQLASTDSTQSPEPLAAPLRVAIQHPLKVSPRQLIDIPPGIVKDGSPGLMPRVFSGVEVLDLCLSALKSTSLASLPASHALLTAVGDHVTFHSTLSSKAARVKQNTPKVHRICEAVVQLHSLHRNQVYRTASSAAADDSQPPFTPSSLSHRSSLPSASTRQLNSLLPFSLVSCLLNALSGRLANFEAKLMTSTLLTLSHCTAYHSQHPNPPPHSSHSHPLLPSLHSNQVAGHGNNVLFTSLSEQMYHLLVRASEQVDLRPQDFKVQDVARLLEAFQVLDSSSKSLLAIHSTAPGQRKLHSRRQDSSPSHHQLDPASLVTPEGIDSGVKTDDVKEPSISRYVNDRKSSGGVSDTEQQALIDSVRISARNPGRLPSENLRRVELASQHALTASAISALADAVLTLPPTDNVHLAVHLLVAAKKLSVHTPELVIAATSGLSSTSLQAAAPWEMLLLVRDLAKANRKDVELSTFPANRWTPAILEMANMKWPDRRDTRLHPRSSSSSSSTPSFKIDSHLPMIPGSRQRYDNPLTWLSNMSHSLAMLGDRGKSLLPTFYTAMCCNSRHVQSLHPAELVAVAAGLAGSGARCDWFPPSRPPSVDGDADLEVCLPGVATVLGLARAGEGSLRGSGNGRSNLHAFLHDLCDLTVAGVGSLTENEAVQAVEAFASLRLPSQLWLLPLTQSIQPSLPRLSNRSLSSLLIALAACTDVPPEAYGFLACVARVVSRNRCSHPGNRNMPDIMLNLRSLRGRVQNPQPAASDAGEPSQT